MVPRLIKVKFEKLISISYHLSKKVKFEKLFKDNSIYILEEPNEQTNDNHHICP